MTGNEWMREAPAPAESSRRDIVPMAVFNAAGGTGSSTIAALVAGYWADRSVSAGWVDAAPGDGDMMGRLGGLSRTVVQRPEGMALWRPSMPGDLVRVVSEAQAEGFTPIVDAGTSATRRIRDVQALVADGVVPVLVIGVRPDLLNRARQVRDLWEDRGVLSSAVIVLNATVPGIREDVLRHVSGDLFEHVARDCIGVDYDQLLGSGLTLLARDRDRLEAATTASVEAIARHCAPRHLAVAQ